MKVTGLCVYPVKSFAGISLQKATLTHRGIEGDREWMVVREDGTFVTQRQTHKMALVTPRFNNGQLTLSAPGISDIVVPAISANAPLKTVKVWKDFCSAFIAHSDVNRWITEVLGFKSPLFLAKFHHNTERLPYQPERFGRNNAKFSDAAPFLVTNTASLGALNQRLPSPVAMARFRANIVIEGLAPFAEHKANKLHFEMMSLNMVDPCSRCAMITIDPATGERDPTPEVFQALATLNHIPNQPKNPAFGVNACLLDKKEGQTDSVQCCLSVGQVFDVD